jgi:hypothetical protein
MVNLPEENKKLPMEHLLDTMRKADALADEDAARIKELASPDETTFRHAGGDAPIYLRLLHHLFTNDADARTEARRLVHKFLPNAPPDFLPATLFAALGKNGEYNRWMLEEIDRNGVDGLKVWQTSISVLGKALHHSSGTVCLNGLLAIAEKGFKSAERSVREETFVSWQVLIDNFGSSTTILNSNKRIRLLTRPLVVSQVVVQSAERGGTCST